MTTIHQETFNAVAKLSPSVTVATAVVTGWTLSDSVLTATLIYTVIQIAIVLRNVWRDHKDGKNRTDTARSNQDFVTRAKKMFSPHEMDQVKSDKTDENK